MIFKSADEILAAYLALTALRAQDVTLGARSEAATACPNPSCLRAENRSAAKRTTINGEERCARCKGLWPFYERGSLGVSIRGSAEGIAKRMHAQRLEAAELAKLLDRPSNVSRVRWAAMLAALELRGYQRLGMRHSDAHRAHVEGLLAVIRLGAGASDRTVDTLARQAREAIESRAARKGILA
jgi:hypothetical protein